MAGAAAAMRRGGARAAAATPLAEDLPRQAQVAEKSGIAHRVGICLLPAVPARPPLAVYRADDDFPAASVIKVAIMMVLYAAWRNGTLHRTPRQERLLQRMVQQSDNEAANLLVDAVGIARVNAAAAAVLHAPRTTRFARKFQARASGPSKNRTSPREMALLLRSLSDREARGDRAAREMLLLMRHTAPRFRQRIPAGVPVAARQRVANKTGTLQRAVNDVALVEAGGGRRYVLSILMDGVADRERAAAFCREISRRAWSGFGRCVASRRSGALHGPDARSSTSETAPTHATSVVP